MSYLCAAALAAPLQTSPSAHPRPLSNAQGRGERPGQVDKAVGDEDPAPYAKQFASYAGWTSSRTDISTEAVSHKGTDEGEVAGFLIQRTWGPGPVGLGSWGRAYLPSPSPAVSAHGSFKQEVHDLTTTGPTKTANLNHPREEIRDQGTIIKSFLPAHLERRIEDLGITSPAHSLQLPSRGDPAVRIEAWVFREIEVELLRGYTYITGLAPMLRHELAEATAERKHHEAKIRLKLRAESTPPNIIEDRVMVDETCLELKRLERDAQVMVDCVSTAERAYEKQLEICSRLITLRGQDIEEERLSRK